jgi:hypothetical protein
MKTGEHETLEPMGGRVAGNTTAYGYDDSDRLTSAVTENPLDGPVLGSVSPGAK